MEIQTARSQKERQFSLYCGCADGLQGVRKFLQAEIYKQNAADPEVIEKAIEGLKILLVDAKEHQAIKEELKQ